MQAVFWLMYHNPLKICFHAISSVAWLVHTYCMLERNPNCRDRLFLWIVGQTEAPRQQLQRKHQTSHNGGIPLGKCVAQAQETWVHPCLENLPTPSVGLREAPVGRNFSGLKTTSARPPPPQKKKKNLSA